MSKYDKETKFYWLQLKEDFFEDDAIEWLEEQRPNGRDYAYFYLKLCLKSLKTNGLLIRNVGNILIPYDNKKLAEITKMDFDTVTVAMELLKEIGLVQILENGEIYMTQLDNLIGSVSKGALKKQQQRLLKNQNSLLLRTNGGQMSNRDRDKDRDRDIIKYNIQSNEFDNEFEMLWMKYPKKQGKKDAKKHFMKAIKNGVAFETINKGLDNYLEYIKANEILIQYVKQGSTWFNQECWNDDYTIQDNQVKSKLEQNRELFERLRNNDETRN